jgi:hypothetical protein
MRRCTSAVSGTANRDAVQTTGAAPAPPALSIRPIDAISANGVVDPFSSIGLYRSDALENRRVDGERGFLGAILPPVDRFGTCEEKYYSGWILGVQPPRQRISSELLSLLPSRFSRSDHDIDAAPSLRQKPVFEMAGGTVREERRKGGCG